MSDTELLKKRFIDLARRAYGSGSYRFTPFLGLAEQSALDEVKRELKDYPYTLYGGTDGAERVMARFGNIDEFGYEEDFPILCIMARPLSEKFADRLTHRDFLGALLNLGIEREVLGDIVVRDNSAYIFAKADITDYIVSTLCRVKHTDVKLSVIDELPEGAMYRTERRRVQISSERLDAIVARLFCLSREDAQSLFSKGLVFVGGRECDSASKTVREGDVVSVRTKGRFVYLGVEGTSKKGKLNVSVDLYV